MDRHLNPTDTIELQLPTGAAVRVNPIGGFVESAVSSAGRPLVFERQVVGGKDRGGIPVCAPIFGPGDAIGLRQHGFARNLIWTVIAQGPTQVSLRLEAPQTQEPELPSRFRGCVMELQVSLDDTDGDGVVLRMALTLENSGTEPFEASPGFHPYFPVPAATTAEDVGLYIEGSELRTFSADELESTHKFGDVPDGVRFRLGAYEVDMQSAGLPYVVAWSADPTRYICVEPTVGGYLSDLPEGPVMLGHGEKRTFEMSILWKGISKL